MGILRFLLAIAVVLVHTNSSYQLVGGKLAVESFYIISGFYMTLILNEKYIKSNNSYKLFITNRFLRIFPLYWVVLILVVGSSVGSYFLAHGKSGHTGATLGFYLQHCKEMNFTSLGFLIFTNIFIFFQDIVYFLGFNTTTGNFFFTNNFRNTNPELYNFLFLPQAWTIGLELMFYLIAPFIVRRNIKIVLAIICLSLGLKILLSTNGLSADPWSYRFFPSELFLFLLGNISYYIYNRTRTTEVNKWFLNCVLFIIIAFTLFYSFISPSIKEYIYIVIIVLAIPFIFNYTKKWRADTFIGELSYPVYISHMFIIMACQKLFPKLTLNELAPRAVIFTLIFSILINELVAKRIEIIRQKRVQSNLANKSEK